MLALQSEGSWAEVPRGLYASTRLLGGLAAAALLSGCLLGPERTDPAVDVPPKYLAGSTKPNAALPAPDWWNSFRSRELTSLVTTAQAMNFDIAAAVARIQQADAQTRVAGAALLPTGSATATAQRSRASQALGSGITGGGIGSERVTYSAVLNASYEIDFWGKNQAGLLSAQESALASRFDRDVVALSTVATVVNTYFQILGAQDRLRIARDSLRTATGVLDVIQQRVNVGTASDLDLSQQQTIVAQLRAAVPPLQQTVDQNIATLAVLLGEPPERTVVRGGSMFRVAIPRVTPGLPSELLLQRPDIGEAEALLAAQDANVYNARAQLFPSIALTAQGGFQSAALATLFTPQAALYTVAANATQPVFDAIRLAALLDMAKGRQIELLQNYRKAVVNAFADVERALVAVRELALEEKSLNDAVVAARRAYQLSESQLRAGTVDITTVLNTQRTLFGAEDAVSQVRLLRLQAIVSLYQALGGGWALIPPPPT